MEEEKALPLEDVTSTVVNINIIAQDGSNVSAPCINGNTIGGGVSNSIDVTKTALRRRAEPDSAGPPSKRMRVEDMCGYVHFLSQLKPRSRRAPKDDKFFTARLQRSTGHVNVVVFNQKSYQRFCDAHTKKLPVSLSKVCFKESQQQVIFNQTSQLSVMPQLDFEYDPKSCEPKIVSSVSEARHCLTGELITITGEIREQQSQKGKQPIRHLLGDGNDSITLTVWGDKLNISAGGWYTISHVEVNWFRGRNELTFTRYTTLTEAPSPATTAEVYSHHKFKVLGTRVRNCHLCPICNAELPLISQDQISVPCPSCENRVSADYIRYMTKGRITVETLQGTTDFNIPRSSMKTLLGLQREGFCEWQHAEDQLLQMKMVEVVFRNNIPVEIKKSL
ncbi:uncharacterized protein si:dkey-249d8.1 [Sardina pilchardus]|uniref:uncharacterized protein si:dkey-249d8.1 n=1 Tax=Sardina pilchardus TaxID=27697 RepID=UPI002E0EA2C9